VSNSIQILNLSKFIKDLKGEESKIVEAAKYATQQVGYAVESETKRLLYNNAHALVNGRWQPSGHVGGPGSPPNRRTGNLASSITTETKSGFGTYTATVFPTMIYARRLEVGLNYPYLRPSADKVRVYAAKIFKTAFDKKWKP